MFDSAKLADSVEGWKEADFKIGETEFFIQKLGPLEAFSTMEKLRVAIAPALTAIRVDEDEDIASGFAAIIGELMKINPAHLAEIREDIFRRIRFKNGIARTGRVLLGSEDMAFKDLLPTHIYEVLGRGLVVNFLECFSDALRRGEEQA